MTTPVYNLKKSLNAMLYVANRVVRKDFHKIFKILYFADRAHLSEYGRVITGDTYIAMAAGPVPSNLYDIAKAVRGDGYFRNRADEFKKFFAVDSGCLISPMKDADMKVLSGSDIEKLDESISTYGNLSMSELTSKSHDYAWDKTPSDSSMSIEDIMQEVGESPEYIQFVSESMSAQKNCL